MIEPRASWGRALAVVPGAAVGTLPACPLCWPVYAGLVSSAGLGFLLDVAYLLPLTVVALLVALVGLGYRAGSRRGYGPLLGGAVAAGLLLAGKFAFDSDSAMALGVAMLMVAAVWNAWPQRHTDRQDTACNCAETSGEPTLTSIEGTRSDA